MKGKPTRVADKTKIIKAKLTNPELSLRDIQKLTGSPKDTVARTIKKVPEIATASDKASNMVDKLDDIINTIINIQQISLGHFQDKAMKQELSTKEVKDLSEIWKTNRERKQIIEGKPTEIKNINFDLSNKTPKELDELRQELLK